jgi:hypothetical protein
MPIESTQIEVHIEEALDATQRSLLETKLEEEGGVFSASFQNNDTHRLVLSFDERRYSQLTLLDTIEELGFHARLP